MNSEHIDQIKRTLDENSFCLLSDFASPDQLPSWSEIIQSVNAAAQVKPDFHVNSPLVERQINSTIRRGVGYFYSFFTADDEHVYPKLKPLTDELEANDLPFFGSSIFMNLFTEDDYASIHKDDWSNNLYIQCEGTTTWMFYTDGDSDKIIDSKKLNPGDAIFFTGDVYHSVTADTPRASVVLRMVRKELLDK